jgi:hypothetical protein
LTIRSPNRSSKPNASPQLGSKVWIGDAAELPEVYEDVIRRKTEASLKRSALRTPQFLDSFSIPPSLQTDHSCGACLVLVRARQIFWHGRQYRIGSCGARWSLSNGRREKPELAPLFGMWRLLLLFFALYDAMHKRGYNFFCQAVNRLRGFQSRQAVDIKHGEAVDK